MDIEIRRREDAARYEAVLDGTVVAYADYHDDGERIVFPHTVTEPRFRGHGLAARVVEAALDDARAAGRAVVPACWFVAQFIDENAEYQDLVAAGG